VVLHVPSDGEQSSQDEQLKIVVASLKHPELGQT
jgi:hypothetical protein